MTRYTVLALVTIALVATDASADGAATVALVDTSRLFAPNGIALWARARAQLDAQKATFVAAESPDGRSPERLEMPELDLPEKQREELKRKLEDIRRKGNQDRAWTTHVEQVLGPIRAATMKGLTDYAKARKIDLVLDRTHLGEAVLVVSAGVDITDAFIKDYNAREPKR